MAMQSLLCTEASSALSWFGLSFLLWTHHIPSAFVSTFSVQYSLQWAGWPWNLVTWSLLRSASLSCLLKVGTRAALPERVRNRVVSACLSSSMWPQGRRGILNLSGFCGGALGLKSFWVLARREHAAKMCDGKSYNSQCQCLLFLAL